MTVDLTDAFAKLEVQLKHNRLCNGDPAECTDRDDLYDGGANED